jgi:GH15 family glucan-1,4-alpha-glucosidase
MPAPPSISDYAVIGDGRTAALISREGSLDWLCLPRFDSPAIFAALLDPAAGGRFSIRPAAPSRVRRRYVGETNVLETTFETGNGVIRLTDFMPAASEEDKGRRLWPEHEILRRVEGMAGEVEVEVICDPRPGYGRSGPRFVDRRALGFRADHGECALQLRSEIPLQLEAGEGALSGRATIRAGERRWVCLGFATDEPAVLPSVGEEAEELLAQTLRWWDAWSGRCDYHGPYRESVIRSALALKLMSYAPSGALVAAPTTSLPEIPGGSSNWDYRYCWLRDASFTVRAMFDLGYREEAQAFLAWLLHATRLTWPELQILYDVFGGTRIPEAELPHLEGYRASRPVRIGNAAAGQLQLDVYGEVVEAAHHFVERGGSLDPASRRMLAGLGRTVIRRWQEADEGIWEPRSGRSHHTASKALCWIAIDRLLRLHQRGQLRLDADELRRTRSAIRVAIEERGYSERMGSYVSVFDGEEVDASLLLLGLHGYADPASPRMRNTHAVIRERLGAGGLLYRLPPPPEPQRREGAFGICCFWTVELRALEGARGEATAEFERLLACANDVGLYGEEIDPVSGEALGNFPQAFTHIGLINAALALEETGLPPRAAQAAAREREPA